VSNQAATREDHSVDLNIRIRISLKEELECRASSEGSSLSNWIEQALQAEVSSPALVPSQTLAAAPVLASSKPDRRREAAPYLLHLVALSALSWASMILVIGIIFGLWTLAFTAACTIGLLLSLLVLESLFQNLWRRPRSKFCDWQTDEASGVWAGTNPRR
jgi:hypothetical protein